MTPYPTNHTDATSDYLTTRLREIFAAIPTQPLTPRHAARADAWPYYVGAAARTALITAAGGPRSISRYLITLATANPTPHHYHDTRPAHLKQTDYARLTSDPPILPMWTDGQDRRTNGRLCLVLPPHIIATFAAVGRYYAITPQSYVMRTAYRPMERLRTTPLAHIDQITPHAATTAVLRAIAVGYLTPINTLGDPPCSAV